MFKKIASTFANCFKIPELKSRIIYTLIVLAVCRVISIIPVPGVNGGALAAHVEAASRQSGGGGVLGMYSMFTGGALEKCAIGAVGIMPYISATIIIQLLSAVIPRLSKLAREEGGRAKIIQYGRYLTVLLAAGWGVMTAQGWLNAGMGGSMFQGFTGDLVSPWLREHAWWYYIQTVIVLTTGTMLLMWFGEQITERGIGNGVSLVITIGILARLPQAKQGLQDMIRGGIDAPVVFQIVALLLLLVAVIAGVVAVTQAQRKIPVQYAQRAVGRKVYQGGTSFMPLRVNYAGVMPVIFAQAILTFPAPLFINLGTKWDMPKLVAFGQMLSERSFFYMFVYGLMILFFSYFWVATQFNEIQIADDLKKYGGYIPGVRPGQATSNFLHNAMSRITLAGAIFLTIIAIIPIILYSRMGVQPNVSQFFGGTSMLILVGVMLDTMRQMESHLLMRHYDGFLKKGRLKGRF
jgi:preprotein translocase subunit SecY